MKRKIRKLRGGGMDASKADFKTPSTNRSVDVPTGGGNQKKVITKTKIGPAVKDVPFKKPLSTTQSFAVSLAVPFLGNAINFGAKQTYKGRQKFAKKQGLYRDNYKTTGKVLQPNSPSGKQLTKDAGFLKNTYIPPVGDNGGPGNRDKKVVKPIIPIEATKPVDPLLIKPKDNFFNFVAYKVGGLSGGVSYGPAPKRGPNPQVPPIKMKKGGYKK
jgi:hypothetical protein